MEIENGIFIFCAGDKSSLIFICFFTVSLQKNWLYLSVVGTFGSTFKHVLFGVLPVIDIFLCKVFFFRIC